MTDVTRGLPEPGQMLLLSAGPGSGKTRTLRRWLHALVLPTVYLRLTPEDRDDAVLRYRLLRLLGDRLPEIPLRLPVDRAWGSTLATLLPPLAVLLDDWHALEGSEAAIQLRAFLWGLPTGSTVAVASRHRFDDSLALVDGAWTLDDPSRPERPQSQDLGDLPGALRNWVLAMALVGEAPPSPEGRELVRRNVAVETTEGRLALRPAWATLARELRPAFAGEAMWDTVADLTEAFAERHRWTQRHAEIASLVAQVPSQVREGRPGLLALEGQQLFAEGLHGEALACFERALALRPSAPELEGWRVAVLAVRDRATGWEAWRSLQASAFDAMPTWVLLLQAQLCWYEGDFATAEAVLRSLLDVPLEGDRLRAHHQLMALCSLCEMNSIQFGPEASRGFIQRLEELSARWDFTDRLPWIAVARQKVAQLDTWRLQPVERLAKVPNAVCSGSLRMWVVPYLNNLAHVAQLQGEPELSLRLLQLCERLTLNDRLGLAYLTSTVRRRQIAPLAELGRMSEARAYHEEYVRHFPAGLVHDVACLEWVRILLLRQEYALASEALGACEPSAPMLVRRRHLYGEAIRVAEGDPAALERLRAWLETPDGTSVRGLELMLLQRLGLATGPAAFRLSAFGALQLSLGREAPLHWSRRKSLHLLAYLVLNPEGVPVTELADKLFDTGAETPPLQALHIASHALRQALKGIGADALFDASQGVYRLDWDGIAFYDLREFDAFYQRARSFERDGHREMAGVFFGIALCYARGELFENLPEDFAEHRAAYRQRVRYAQAFAHRHSP